MSSTPMFDFSGATYDPKLDRERLNRQISLVKQVMADEQWRTLLELEDAIGAPQASISARLRDLRKQRFGGYAVLRRRRSQGTFEYRVLGISRETTLGPIGPKVKGESEELFDFRLRHRDD